ncbi:MAG: VOC family protein [Solirubrobacterales bacterium]
MEGAAPEHSIAAATRPGAVTLTVADLPRVEEFYRQAIGLELLDRSGREVVLGAGGRPLVRLHGDPAAPPRGPRATGLFHLALLVEDRGALATSMERVLAAGRRFTGAADHLVSDALYLDDPEGNGIELYRDRPRERWERDDEGRIAMDSLPLDVGALRAEAGSDPAATVPPTTIMGHVHLRVAGLAAAERFYVGVLGLDITVRGYPGALFASAGGYHHHIGLNVWHSAGSDPPPPGSRGLASYELLLPGGEELERVVARARRSGIAVDTLDGRTALRDPAGNQVLLALA